MIASSVRSPRPGEQRLRTIALGAVLLILCACNKTIEDAAERVRGIPVTPTAELTPPQKIAHDWRERHAHGWRREFLAVVFPGGYPIVESDEVCSWGGMWARTEYQDRMLRLSAADPHFCEDLAAATTIHDKRLAQELACLSVFQVPEAVKVSLANIDVASLPQGTRSLLLGRVRARREVALELPTVLRLHGAERAGSACAVSLAVLQRCDAHVLDRLAAHLELEWRRTSATDPTQPAFDWESPDAILEPWLPELRDMNIDELIERPMPSYISEFGGAAAWYDAVRYGLSDGWATERSGSEEAMRLDRALQSVADAVRR